MENMAIIGGGISGLSAAQCFKNRSNVTLFEKNKTPGGLIRCSRFDGNLYHIVGGHVFNSKRKDVLEMFWSYFDREGEFQKALRDARISIPDYQKNEVDLIGYPIEDHIFQLKENIQKDIIKDLVELNHSKSVPKPENFEEFLKSKFGETLYRIYFKPYNEKIWRRELKQVPLSWLEGKLPMPSFEEIVINNIQRKQERNMVHSSFYYAKNGGSQFIADRLSEGINIKYDTSIKSIAKIDDKWIINQTEVFDKIIFTGNVKDLNTILKGDVNTFPFYDEIENLDFHGTTSVLCHIDKIPYSWVYMPDSSYSPHRIICTGNFSKNNNSGNSLSATIEFTDYKSKKDILEELNYLPCNPKYIAHTYTKYTYPIQSVNTKKLIQNLKKKLTPEGFYLLGRFAEWEYYNMDTAMGAAIDLAKTIEE